MGEPSKQERLDAVDRADTALKAANIPTYTEMWDLVSYLLIDARNYDDAYPNPGTQARIKLAIEALTALSDIWTDRNA